MLHEDGGDPARLFRPIARDGGVDRGGDEIMLEIVEGACIRRDEGLPEGTICFTNLSRRAGYRETFVWRNKHHYEAPDVGLRPDVERVFFEGFMERARDKFL